MGVEREISLLEAIGYFPGVVFHAPTATRSVGHPRPIPVPSAVESYTWSPSHDHLGMLRPLGTSSADSW
jgi:hypothetical protein